MFRDVHPTAPLHGVIFFAGEPLVLSLVKNVHREGNIYFHSSHQQKHVLFLGVIHRTYLGVGRT